MPYPSWASKANLAKATKCKRKWLIILELREGHHGRSKLNVTLLEAEEVKIDMNVLSREKTS